MWEGIKDGMETGTERTPSFNYFFYCHYILCSFSTCSYMISPQLNPIVDFYTNCISDNLYSALLIARDRSTFCPAQLHLVTTDREQSCACGKTNGDRPDS